MSKAVMKSVSPKQCEKIASYECTMLLSKTKPKIDTPFKCYIYCSQNQFMARKTNGDFWFAKRNSLIQPIDSIQFSGKVIGEFICDCIDETYPIIFNSPDKYIYLGDWVKNKANTKNTCLSLKELSNYGKGKPLYACHISNLKIYNKPKELSEFCIMKKCNACKSGYESNACIYDNNCKVPVPLTRPPQSWCYVEELSNEI